ncbi:anaerobic sulfatase maturase [Candidatus Poribacteria bacterium]|nr:anaerobic sulfatase maturase [Candidatus Poribacteria bacterium]
MNHSTSVGVPYHVMAKPIGPLCNLDCKYCFYLEKEALYPPRNRFRMSSEVLEAYVSQYIESQPGSEIHFAWQGGEPTLMGVDFFRRVVELQAQHCPPDKRIANAFQTNATLLDDEWCAFLAENRFLVGVSIDGPRHLHDRYRVDKQGQPTFDLVMRGIELLKRYRVEFNTLTVVNRVNSRHPLEVYSFLKEHGSGYMQFIPLVERAAPPDGLLTLAPPPALSQPEEAGQIATPWSVEPVAFGDFLSAIFDEWVRHDVGSVYVQLFDVQLGIWLGLPSAMCVFGETCGNALALEHNGDLYACDHYVYPEHRVGNITDAPMRELVDSPQQRRFGDDKREALPRYCRECDVRFACHGECPKHRFLTTPDGEPGLNYLCAGYKRFFRHIDPYMKEMARLVERGQPASQIMQLLAERKRIRESEARWQRSSRNDPCPCGSGRKYKRCCWNRAQASGAR